MTTCNEPFKMYFTFNLNNLYFIELFCTGVHFCSAKVLLLFHFSKFPVKKLQLLLNFMHGTPHILYVYLLKVKWDAYLAFYSSCSGLYAFWGEMVIICFINLELKVAFSFCCILHFFSKLSESLPGFVIVIFNEFVFH